jgi:hypothetical protein
MIKLKNLVSEMKTDVLWSNPNFRTWFGDSKVIDKNRNPMIVFHGTKTPPLQFSRKRMGWGSTMFGNYQIERHGIFAAEDPQLANEFVNAGDDEKERILGHSIMPLLMRIESPIDTTKAYSDALFNAIEEWGDNHTEWFDDKDNPHHGYRIARILGDAWGNKMWLLFDKDSYNDPEMWITMFKDLGYDGLRMYEQSEIENNISWVAFDPSQVKSAIGNIGKFDDSNSDITGENIQ